MGRIKKVTFSQLRSSKRLSNPRSPEEENEEPMENGVQQVKLLRSGKEVKGLKSKVEKKKKVKNTGISMVKQEVKEKLKVKLQLNTKLVAKSKILNKRGKKDKAKGNKNKVLVENAANTTDEENIYEESERIASPVSNGRVNSLPSVTDENQNESKDAEEDSKDAEESKNPEEDSKVAEESKDAEEESTEAEEDSKNAEESKDAEGDSKDAEEDKVNLKAAKKMKRKAKKASKKVVPKVRESLTKKAPKEVHDRVASPISQYNINEEDNLSCRICHQVLDENLKFYSGTIEDDHDVIDDFNSMSKIEKDNEVSKEDKNYYKLTSFSIFCKNGHVCPFESVLLSDKEDILISGCLKSVGRIIAPLKKQDPPKNLGPIIDWWVIEHNGREAIVCSTKNEDVILSQPSKEYAAFMKSTNLGLFIAKKIIEYLTSSPTAVYQDLLSKLEIIPMLKDEPSFSEDVLLHQMPFIINQLIMFDQTARPHEPLLTTAPCIRRLIKLAGIDLNNIKLPKANPRRNEQINAHREKLLSNVTQKKRRETHEVLAEVANNPFLLAEKPAGLSSRRCGACESCQRPACDVCLTCELREPDRCMLRRCLLQEIQAANEEDSMNDSLPILESAKVKLSLTAYAEALGKFPSYASSFSWLGEPVAHDEDGSVYYKSMLLNGEEIREGDYVLAGAAVLRIAYLWRDETGTARLHASHLWRARDTPLGALGEHRELLHTAKCCVLPVTCVLAKLPVVEGRTAKNWDKSAWNEKIPEGYYCQRSFDPVTGRFEDLPLEDDDSLVRQTMSHRFCANCVRAEIEARRNTPYPYEELGDYEDVLKFGAVKYRGEEYRIGSCVYLKPRTLYFKYPMLQNHVKTRGERIKYIDEEKYPEYYRKIKEEEERKNKADAKLDMSAPFDVGYITEIFTCSDKLYIKVKKLYRPENTHKRESFIRQADYNMLFWSNEESSVLFSYVVGKCFLSHSKNLKTRITEWSLQGPDRFYFSQIYENKEFYNIDKKDYASKIEVYDEPKVYPKTNLKTMNIFAGCGGLALGLRQAGVANICWAIEPDSAAALTFKLNNLDTTVINDDCNEVLKKFVGGEKSYQNQCLPLRGEVELLCASLSNEFITDVTTFTNSRFATFVSYCEVYRPIYFILETDEILAKKNIVLKLTIACLLSIGYQVSFDMVQVGCFGVPLNQNKLIILGAAPGRKLPKNPKPLHVFPKVYCSSGVVIDNKKYVQNNESTVAAPYRVVTIRDALADLPNMTVENCIEVTSYSGQLTSYFQKMMRLNVSEATVLNHVCKNLGPLVQARISQIPLAVGADWRNLPNIEMKLSDGSVTKKLVYKYNDKEAGKNSLDGARGVCACSEGKKCSFRDRQENSLVPWHLVHSAKRNCHWSGLYSRLQWDGFFNGTITNPEPLSEQSAVIHPNQHRVVSVRECARAQGFPDNFLFPQEIEILDKYRIIGSATSPRLAFALGYEIARSLAHES